MNKLRLRKKLKEYKRKRLTTIRKIAKNSVIFFKVKNFGVEGFIDSSVDRWKPRKKKRPGRLLVKTGKGRASIREKSVSTKGAVIEAGADYMKYHNEGTKHLPKRQFMGNSGKLDKENVRIIKREFRNVL